MWSDKTGDISNMSNGFIYMSSIYEMPETIDKYVIDFSSSQIRNNIARAANGMSVRSHRATHYNPVTSIHRYC